MIAAKRDVYANEYALPDYNGESQDYLQLVEREDQTKQAVLRKDKIVLVVGILCMFSLALLYTFMAAKITMGGYTINSLKADIDTIENQNHRLTLEIEEKSSLKRIETLAISELGMIAPNGKDVCYVSMDTNILTASAEQGAQANQASQANAGNIETAARDSQANAQTEKNTHPMFLALNKLFFQ